MAWAVAACTRGVRPATPRSVAACTHGVRASGALRRWNDGRPWGRGGGSEAERGRARRLAGAARCSFDSLSQPVDFVTICHWRFPPPDSMSEAPSALGKSGAHPPSRSCATPMSKRSHLLPRPHLPHQHAQRECEHQLPDGHAHSAPAFAARTSSTPRAFALSIASDFRLATVPPPFSRQIRPSPGGPPS